MIISQEGEAFFISAENAQVVLALLASGQTVNLGEFGISIGDYRMDITGMSQTDAHQALVALRRELTGSDVILARNTAAVA